MRNYKAMNDEKLQGVIEELQTGTGDARAREGDNWKAALSKAIEVADERGVKVQQRQLAEVPSPPESGRGIAVPWMPKPMLAKPIDEVPEGDDWIIEAKVDGWRGLALVHYNRVQVLAGRNATDHTGEAPHIEELLEFLPPGTVLDGELVVNRPGAQSGDVRHSLAHKLDDLIYVVFDVLRWEHRDMTRESLSARKELLEANWLDSLGPAVQLMPYVPASGDQHEVYVANGFEGSVSKRLSSLYQVGRKSDDWGKVKASETIDALIIGVESGKGASNKHLPGAFTVRLPSGVETSAKIKNDEMVAAVARDPEEFVGKLIVELKYNAMMRSGKPRHPVVKQVRHDYDVATWEAAR